MNPSALLAQVPDPAGIGTFLITNSMAWFGNFLILIILTFVFLIVAMRGRLTLVYLMIAFYMAYGLYMIFPYTQFLVDLTDIPILRAVTSIILFGVATIIPYRFIVRLAGGGVGIMTFFTNLILAFLTAAFVMALGYHLFEIGNIFSLPAPMNELFAPEGYFFYWFAAPLIGAYLLVH